MNENVIVDTDGDIFGFYSDVLEHLKSEFIEEIKNNNFGVINPDWIELLEDVKKLEEYDGIIKISENNGMGWTAEKFTAEKPKSHKLAADFFADAGAIMGQNLDNYASELLALKALYKHNDGVILYSEDIKELKARAEKLAGACADILENS